MKNKMVNIVLYNEKEGVYFWVQIWEAEYGRYSAVWCGAMGKALLYSLFIYYSFTVSYWPQISGWTILWQTFHVTGILASFLEIVK